MEGDERPSSASKIQRPAGPPKSLTDIIDGSRSRFTRAEAEEIVGGLSRTTKMPCHSWGIPAQSCHVGSALAKIEGTTCHDCYALKGAYAWPQVQRAYERRLARADHPDWVDAMSTLVRWQAGRNREPYFRWFDSGDLQSLSMLERIAEVAKKTPEVNHWLPTREHAIVRQYVAKDDTPENLTIRLSALLIDGNPPKVGGLPTSTVHRTEGSYGNPCPAYDQRPASCGSCRSCWDKNEPNVSYRLH